MYTENLYRVLIHFLVLIVLVLTLVTPVSAANILIVAGTDGIAQTSAANLNTDLSGSNTVTIVNTGVPASLAGYTQIYDVRYNNKPAFSTAEVDQYKTFLNAASGNTLFLMGENSGATFLTRNTAINDFIASAGGGTISVPAIYSSAKETAHAPFNGPNACDYITFAAVGIVTSSGTGSFASTEAGGTSGGSIYFTQNTLANAPTGALVVVYDVNFIYDPQTRSSTKNETVFRQNLEHFVATAAAPTVSSISPSSGPLAGGTSVAITGTGFTGATAVKFGLTDASSYTVNSATSITATSPAGSAGTVDITVTTSGGTSATGASDRFTYTSAPSVSSISPSSGPLAGGTSVAITGAGFTGATAAKFGLTDATSYTVNSATSITATSPAGSAGIVDITVTTSSGTSATGASDRFTYAADTPTPTPTPASGSPAGDDSGGKTAGAGASVVVSPGAPAGQSMAFHFNNGNDLKTSLQIIDVQVIPSRQVGETSLLVAPVTLGTAHQITTRPVAGYREIEPLGINPSAFSSGIISFRVTADWMAEHQVTPQQVVMLRDHDNVWSELATTFDHQDANFYYFTAITPGFSNFAVAVRNTAPVTTVPSVQTTVSVSTSVPNTVSVSSITAVQTPVPTTIRTTVPTTLKTTVVPAAASVPSGSSGFPVISIFAGTVAIVLVVVAVFVVRRWWIRRQNPALFRKYD